MKILGIDPGTAKTGYAIIEVKNGSMHPHIYECACIDTPAGIDMSIRLKQLHDNLFDIIEQYSPDLMVVEKLFFNTNVKTAITVGQARGIPLLIAGHKKMLVFEYTALQAKLVVAGYGRASKKEMQEAVRIHMGLKEVIKPDDANDAMAMALCYLDKEYDGFDLRKIDGFQANREVNRKSTGKKKSKKSKKKS